MTCGFIYDEAEGSPDEGIAPGTRWEDVPEDWESPVELPNRPGDETVSLFRKRFG